MSGGTRPLVVYSHLRWNFVYQRPQHVLSRLARNRQVVFVEEPTHGEGALRLEVSFPAANVLRCVPSGRVEARTFDGGAYDRRLATLLRGLLHGMGHARHVAWLYTPMALPLMLALEPEGIVYDCMDELSAFHGAPPALVERERKLFTVADLVFTGGPSLYRAKRDRHPNVHCFPSSVDVAHFRQAGPLRPRRQPPRLGFYGVLDERLDRELVAAVAERRPDWQLEMVGPVVKIDPSTLPKAANLRYPGPCAYEKLPALLATWDVCLMPFAVNEATRFISPTKVLEYMAASRPIVSTPITDVAEPYGDVVRIAGDADAFVAACASALDEAPAERERRSARMAAIVAARSWDGTVQRMGELLDALPTDKGDHEWHDTKRSSSAPVRPD